MIHQATELWLKLMVHELRAARRQIIADDLQPAFKMLARVSQRIQHAADPVVDVLSTLTPADYLAFRHRLGPASGLQSHQYRLLEVRARAEAARDARCTPHPRIEAELRRELEAPSLYDEAIRLLARRGFAIAPEVCQRDWSRPYRSDAERARRLADDLPGSARAGTCTSWPRSWSIWRTGSGSGVFAT